MKFRVSMKDPDTLEDSIKEAVREEVAQLGLAQDEAESVEEVRREKISEQCTKWFEWGEYLEVEIDTEADTCTVVQR